MADAKISQLTPVTGANLQDTDLFVVARPAGELNFSLTRAEMFIDAPEISTETLSITTIQAFDGTSAGSIADSTGVVTLASAVLTTADINGGTIDGTTIGGSTAAAGSFTNVTANGTINLAGATVSNGGSVTTVDINGGTIDGTVIGGSVPAEITASQYNSTEALPDIKPSLNLDFANTKKLDPRITFTRGSTAAYYDGVTFAKAEENLLIRSQEFDNAVWLKDNLTVTANTENSPDGSTTADTIVEENVSQVHRLRRELMTSSGVVTLSVFAKSGSGSRFLTIGVNNSTANYASATFDLSAGTNTQTLVAGTYSAQSATITASADGFYRCSLTVTTDLISQALIGLSATSTFSNASRGFDIYTGDGTSSIILWGAQLEQRDALTDYTATTDQPITNYIPALQTAASGEARFDHDPITGESKGLLIEEQRTNLVTYSEQFDNAAWTNARSSITANAVVAPDGTLTGDKLIEDTTASSTHYLDSPTATTSTDATVVFSFFAKAGERNVIDGYLVDSGIVSTSRFTINLSTGTIVSGANATIAPVGNGWYRCSVFSTISGTSAKGRILLSDGTTAVYTGDGYSGIYLWGAQLEAGAFPTSYIPTVASQVTRSPDAASMTGTNFSSWYRQDEGTVFVEGGDTSRAGILYALEAGSLFTNGIFGEIDNNGEPGAVVWSGGTRVSDIDFPALSNPPSVVAAFKTNDFAISVDGQTVVTDTAGAMPSAPITLRIGQRGTVGHINGHIKKLSFYPKRLSNATLQALTEE